MAGIELDADLGPLQVVASLSAELGRQNDLNEKRYQQMRKMNAQRARTPIDVRFMASGICPTATAPFAISIDGPQAGFYHLVRRIVVGGVAWATVAAGAVELYVSGLGGMLGGAAPAGLAAIRSLDLIVDANATLPFRNYYSNHQIVIQPSETLAAVIVGGTAGQQYSLAIEVEVHRALSAQEVDIS